MMCSDDPLCTLSHQHHVWDVHCDNDNGGKERWRVITNPTNL